MKEEEGNDDHEWKGSWMTPKSLEQQLLSKLLLVLDSSIEKGSSSDVDVGDDDLQGRQGSELVD